MDLKPQSESGEERTCSTFRGKLFTENSLPGLMLGTRTSLVEGSLPIPTIWAEPGSVVAKGQSVTIWCLGTEEAQVYYLHKRESSKPWETPPSPEPGNKINFSIPSMTEHYAGSYYCRYRSPAGWSQHSDDLDLVVTGFYQQPSISALPSTQVTPGRNVTLQCSSQQRYGRYILTNDGEQNMSWTQDSQQQSNRHFHALFTVGPVTSKHRWELRCYGYYQRTSHMWSVPSDALQLLLLESHPQDHTVENLIRLAISGLVLVVLGIILCEDWYSQRRTQMKAGGRQ